LQFFFKAAVYPSLAPSAARAQPQCYRHRTGFTWDCRQGPSQLSDSQCPPGRYHKHL